MNNDKYEEKLNKQNKKIINSTTLLGISSLITIITYLETSNMIDDIIIDEKTLEKLVLTCIADGSIAIVSFKSLLEALIDRYLLKVNNNESNILVLKKRK